MMDADSDIRRCAFGVFACSSLVTRHLPLFQARSCACVVTHRKLKTHGSAQHFHRVSANTNVRDTLAVARCSHIHFARTTDLDALSNQHLFGTVCDPVLDHPTRGATGRRSRSRIFSAIKKHAGANPAPVFAFLGTNEVAKLSARF